MKKLSLFVYTALTLSICTSAFSLDIYKSKDNSGTPTYSDKKPEGDYQLISSEKKKPFGSRKKPATEADSEAEADPIPFAQTRDVESVRSVVNSARGHINSLYMDIYNKDDSTQGKVLVKFTIGKDGAISNCDEDESEMNTNVFNGKICEKLQSLNYGAVAESQSTVFTFTYTFKPAA
jgi:hypothetical protein